MAKRYKPPRDTPHMPSTMPHIYEYIHRIRASRQYSIKTCTSISISPTAKTRRTKFQSSFISQLSNYGEITVITTAAPHGASFTVSDLRLRIPASQNMHRDKQTMQFSHDSSGSAPKSRRVLKFLKLLKHLQSCTQTQQSRAQFPQIMDDGTQILECVTDPYSQSRFKTHLFTHVHIPLTRRSTETTSREHPRSRTYITGRHLHLTPLSSHDRKTIPSHSRKPKPSVMTKPLSKQKSYRYLQHEITANESTIIVGISSLQSLISMAERNSCSHISIPESYQSHTKAPCRISDKLSTLSLSLKETQNGACKM
jgi:hypothetical protein